MESKEKVKEIAVKEGFTVYSASYGKIEDSFFMVIGRNGEKYLLMEKNLFNLKGQKVGKWFIFSLTSSLLKFLREVLNFLNPEACLSKPSFGFGDRLGISTPAHISSFSGYSVFPFLAQQSVRELERTRRSMEEVIESAAWGCLESGYRGKWGADADHLKNMQEVKESAKAGFTMFTLDISDFLNPEEDIPETWQKKIRDLEGKSYPHTNFNRGLLEELTIIYWKGLEFVKEAYYYLKGTLTSFNLELSVDESGVPTTPQAHIFIVESLKSEGVEITSFAPCFPGSFQKGVDYKGNQEEFRRSFKIHSEIASLGGYRLSLHSGSDKFSLYPLMKPYLPFHVKTSGTTWLEGVFTIAEVDFSLFQEIMKIARTSYPQDRRSYEVSASLRLCPDTEEIKRGIPQIFENPHLRQILHVTYGSVLRELKEDIMRCLLKNEDSYCNRVSKHLRRHVEKLYEEERRVSDECL
ncbi:hypothetical protein J7K43_06875 [Candidatus Calescamantes bacterium]|nr:hypothetical protein [Candidatus Calescamantes bacterium]